MRPQEGRQRQVLRDLTRSALIPHWHEPRQRKVQCRSASGSATLLPRYSRKIATRLLGPKCYLYPGPYRSGFPTGLEFNSVIPSVTPLLTEDKAWQDRHDDCFSGKVAHPSSSS
jgi:hypothetical protein